ncbi:MAG: DUF305 domain-containing protein [Candidatus Altimarinota bacterium]
MKTYKIILALGVILVVIAGFFLINNMSQHNMGSMGNMQVTSEKDFITQMIPHHQEAIDTSKIVGEETNNEELKSLTQAIISAQENEISIMKDILKTKYQTSGESTMYHNMMGDLTQLSGSELEKSYLEGMIEHHKGAIEMAKSVENIKLSPEIKEIVNNIILSQENEINMMKDMLQKE